MAACTSFATEIHIIIPTWINATVLSVEILMQLMPLATYPVHPSP